MRMLIFSFFLGLTGALGAQEFRVDGPPPDAEVSIQPPQQAGARVISPPGEVPNRIRGEQFNYTGVIPQAVKRNPLQLINPAAPPEAGSGAQNVVPPLPGDPAPKLKLFALEF